MEGTSLDDILSNEPQEPVEAPPAEAAPETPPEPEEAPSEPVRDEKGRFVAKTETGVEDQGPPPTELPKEEYKAIREEREKRQNLERELEALKQQFQQAQQPPPAPPPSMWEDEERWKQHFGNEVVNAAVERATIQSTLNVSAMMAGREHADFKELQPQILEYINASPDLSQQVLSDPHPWDAAYRVFKNAQTVKELGATDIDTLKAKIREELMAEMQAQTPVPQQGLTLPPSLTGERNVGNRSGPAWTGPRPLSELLG